MWVSAMTGLTGGGEGSTVDCLLVVGEGDEGGGDGGAAEAAKDTGARGRGAPVEAATGFGAGISTFFFPAPDRGYVGTTIGGRNDEEKGVVAAAPPRTPSTVADPSPT